MTQISHKIDNQISGPTLRTVFNILEAWQMDEPVQLAILGLPRSTYYRWRKSPDSANLDPNILERASYILGIYKDLQILLPDAQAADSWVNRPNTAPIFGGEPPRQRLAAGHVADLYLVRQFLDAARGG